MNDGITMSSDGISLNYAVSEFQEGKPWIALVIPFGLKLSVAKPFFDFFQPQYNIVSWESRLILVEDEQTAPESPFELHKHVADFETILAANDVRKCIVVGYCSGAGVALGAANRYPQRISRIVLVHGEYVLLDEPECSTQFAREIDGLLSMAHQNEDQLRQIYEKVREERLDPGDSRPDGIDLPYSKISYLRRYAENYDSYKKEDFKRLATYVTHPTLLMTGKRDAQSNVNSTIAIKDVMPNATSYVDEDADHYGILREDSKTLIALWNYLYAERSVLH